MKEKHRNIDTTEFELPKTVFIRDIESKVLQGIVLKALSKIDGIALVEDEKKDAEKIRSIVIEQEPKKHLVTVKVELLVCYGIAIPAKTEEVQMKIVEEISTLTGLHVSSVHVIIRGLLASHRCPLKEPPVHAVTLQTNTPEGYAEVTKG